jgi:hypothetical protein
MLETVATIIGLALFLVPLALIVQKAGYSPLWVLLAFVPLVNFLALVYFAVSEWPIEEELQLLTRKPKSPADAKAESSWELKRLAKRVATLGQLAASEGPNKSVTELLDTTGNSATEYFKQTLISLQQFGKRTTNDDERAFAETLLENARSLEGRIQDG